MTEGPTDAPPRPRLSRRKGLFAALLPGAAWMLTRAAHAAAAENL